MDNTNMQITQEIKKKKWLLPVILGVVALVVIGAGIAGLFYFKSIALPKKELQKQLDLGDKYLTDMDYDSAIIAYKAAIEIDPKCEAAYLGLGRTYKALAEECVENDETEEAIEYLQDGIKLLKNGYSNTNSEKIKDALDELKKMKEELEEKPKTEEKTEPEREAGFVPIDISELPSGLLELLKDSQGFDYESEEAIKYQVFSMLCFAADNRFGFNRYSDYINVPANSDFRNNPSFYTSDANGNNCFIFDADGIDWILKNIYNVSDSVLSKCKEPSYISGYIQYENGKYRAQDLAMPGGEEDITIVGAEREGNKYHIVYDSANVYDPDDPGTKFYAVLEYKDIDGKGYWSIYKVSTEALFDTENKDKDKEANQGNADGFEVFSQVNKTFYIGDGAEGFTMTLNTDGTFVAGFSLDDTDSSCTGKFQKPAKINDYMYKLTIESLNEVNNYTDDYGVYVNGIFYLYLKGAQVEDLPAEFVYWVKSSGKLKDSDTTLPFDGLYISNERYGLWS